MTWGDGSTDEMCLGLVFTTPPTTEAESVAVARVLPLGLIRPAGVRRTRTAQGCGQALSKFRRHDTGRAHVP